MSAQLAIAQPRRITATHRRRRKIAAGHFVQRYYDPGIGRMLSVDPMASDTTTGWNFNRYNYAANNPYRFTDPDGRSVQDPNDEPFRRGPMRDGLPYRRPCNAEHACFGTDGRSPNGRTKPWNTRKLTKKEKKLLVFSVAKTEGIDMRDVLAVVVVGGGGGQMVNGVLTLGEDNFKSRSMLASVTLHETTHNKQDVNLAYSYKGELEATKAQIDAFDQFNNTPAEMKLIQSQYDEYYKLVYPGGKP